MNTTLLLIAQKFLKENPEIKSTQNIRDTAKIYCKKS